MPAKLRRSRKDLPARLRPIFRDRDELASSADLSASIRQSINDSDTLIVMCSPAAASSRWVNEEIHTFRRLAPGRTILCLMVAGSPDPEAHDCALPTALLNDENGHALPEPLAADVSPSADGKRGALLKIIAGLLGVGIDDLKQRDQQRKLRLVSAVAAGALLIAAVTIGLAINAHYARTEAELRRDQAEGLIEFMLGDLRGKLEPIGKLDILDAVGDQAQEYFTALGDLGSNDEVLARAMAMRQIGEVRFGQGNLAPALKAFTESRNITAALHESSPQDERILFELGQAEFWVGYVAWERKDLHGAEVAFQAYRDASTKLAARHPDNADYTLELAYAASNLGSVARERGKPAEAFRYFSDAVDLNERLLTVSPDDTDLRYDLAEGLSWMGSAQLDLGDLPGSEATLRRSHGFLSELHDRGIRARHSEGYGDVSALLAEVQTHRGEVEQAQRTIDIGLDVFSGLVERDPDNARWGTGLYRMGHLRTHLLISTGQADQARSASEQSYQGLMRLAGDDPSNMDLQQRLARTEALAAMLDLEAGRSEQAREKSQTARLRSSDALRKGSKSRKEIRHAVEILDIDGEILMHLGESEQAMKTWAAAINLLGPVEQLDPINKALYVRLMKRVGRGDEAATVEAELAAMGFLDPRYLTPAATG